MQQDAEQAGLRGHQLGLWTLLNSLWEGPGVLDQNPCTELGWEASEPCTRLLPGGLKTEGVPTVGSKQGNWAVSPSRSRAGTQGKVGRPCPPAPAHLGPIISALFLVDLTIK